MTFTVKDEIQISILVNLVTSNGLEARSSLLLHKANNIVGSNLTEIVLSLSLNEPFKRWEPLNLESLSSLRVSINISNLVRG